ncbi:DUF839 domain-containing protein [Ectothiorhodospiraceae bacterium WFHF3C12]|nr:DUF839 domain-containing protein [Ectothiorhodospiraceae bacterium WFHF3C12]
MTERNGIDLSRLSALALAALLAAGVAGCGGDDGDDGVDGTDGAAGAPGSDGADGADGVDGADGQDGTDALTSARPAGLKRLATVPLGAEITGIELTADGDLFFNVQHPDDANDETDASGVTYNLASLGVIRGHDFSAAGGTDIPDLALPITAAEKETVRTAVGTYNVLGQEGDTFGGDLPNGLGRIVATDGTTAIKQSNDPDFNGYVRIDADNGWLFSNWEDRPGGMSRLRVQRDTGTGEWSVINDAGNGMIDFSSVNGTWVNCFGTMSPWSTPLTSEELYFDDTADWNNANYDYHGDQVALETYLGGTYPNPYDYGYIVEITDPAGAATPVKHFTLGRFSHENAEVMPDDRTVYLSDDGTGTVLFKFVADAAGDLSSGSLYAAAITQANVTHPAEAALAIEWIELASGDNATIEGWVDEYDGIDTSDYVAGQNSYISDEEINNWAEGKTGQDLDGDGTVEDDSFGDDRVAFLESRKAAVALGATGEFRKKEGLRVNRNRAEAAVEGTGPLAGSVSQAFAYVAMSNVNATMTDGQGDIQIDDIAGDCGVVYRMPLEADYDISRMEPVLVGGPYYPERAVNNCNVNNISEPDNVIVLDDGKVVIGEDTGEHENNMLWLFDPEA